MKLATKFRPEAAAFELAEQAGFEHAELWLNAELLNHWKSIAELSQRYSLGYAVHFPNHGVLTNDSLRHAVDLCHAVDASALVIHQPMFDRYGAALRVIDSALDIAIENHRLDEAQLFDWAEINPGLALDVEHVWMLTLNDSPLERLLELIDELLTRCAHKLQHVHLPGYIPGGPAHRPMWHSAEMAVAALDLLERHQFTKLVVSESNADYQTLDELSRDVQFFNRWRNGMTEQAQAHRAGQE